jgi:hypothetical protein
MGDRYYAGKLLQAASTCPPEALQMASLTPGGHLTQMASPEVPQAGLTGAR